MIQYKPGARRPVEGRTPPLERVLLIYGGNLCRMASGAVGVYDLSHFSLSDMTRCGIELRRLSSRCDSMETVATAIVRHLYGDLHQGDPPLKACVLVRLYKTHEYGDLPDELREFGRRLMPTVSLESSTKCLTLLGTAGDLAEWNSRHDSRRHKAIPLPSEHVVDQIPMIAQLIRQLGLAVSSIIEPHPEIIKELDQKTYNVFYVPDAKGSPHIPAQAEFVVPNHVESALGFGGMLPDGNLFAVIMFSRAQISPSTAEMFRTIALNVKLAILPFVGGRIFAAETASVAKS
jgi:two-component system, NtrC family, sensor kinase